MKKSNKKKPTWSDLRRLISDLDRPALFALFQYLYAVSRNNKPNSCINFARLHQIHHEII